MTPSRHRCDKACRMHGFHDSDSPAPLSNESGPWYKSLNRYHWFVFVVAALGWLFDTMDQQLFTLARPLAMADLIPAVVTPAPENETAEAKVTREAADKKATAATRGAHGGFATSIFLMGWATGGLVFGVLGDGGGGSRRCWPRLLSTQSSRG